MIIYQRFLSNNCRFSLNLDSDCGITSQKLREIHNIVKNWDNQNFILSDVDYKNGMEVQFVYVWDWTMSYPFERYKGVHLYAFLSSKYNLRENDENRKIFNDIIRHIRPVCEHY